MIQTPSFGVKPCTSVTNVITKPPRHSVRQPLYKRPHRTHRPSQWHVHSIDRLARPQLSIYYTGESEASFSEALRTSGLKEYALVCKYNTATGREAEQDNLEGVEDCRQSFRSLVNRLQVDLFSPGSREHRAKFQPDEEPRECKAEAEHPEHERCPDGANGIQDSGRRGENTCSNDSSDTYF